MKRFTPYGAFVLATLYFSQGLPSGLLSQALPALLREQGVGTEYIGLIKLLALPWMLKFLWAPVIDKYPSARFGASRAWIVPLQGAVVFSLLVISCLDYEHLYAKGLYSLFCLLFLLNLFCASQDVATDSLAIRVLPEKFRGLGNSIQVVGYKVGMILGGAALLASIEWLGWSSSFQIMALTLALLTIPVILFDEKPYQNKGPALLGVTQDKQVGQGYFASGFKGFFERDGMWLWVIVLVSFKVGDSYGSAMIKPLLVDVGFELSEIATITIASSTAGLFGAFLGGVLYLRIGMINSFILSGVSQAVGLIGFSWISLQGNEISHLSVYLIAVFEQMADGMSTVVLFAVMMSMCRSGHEGGDYTLQASLQMLVAGTLGVLSGWSVKWLGYGVHFLIAGVFSFAALIPVMVWFSRPSAKIKLER